MMTPFRSIFLLFILVLLTGSSIAHNQTTVCHADTPSLLSRATRLISTEDWPKPVFRRNSARPYSWRTLDTLVAIKTGGKLIEINVTSGQERLLFEEISPMGLVGIHTSP